MERVLLFYNPSSGNGMFKTNLDYIISRYQEAGKRITAIRASGDSGINEFMAEIGKEEGGIEFSQVLAAGGDGTINVCVNARLDNGVDLPLGILPAGTANDFASYFEIPNNIETMLDIALGDKYTYADVGVVNDRYFINVAAIGQVVDVSQKTDPTLKNTIGVLAYYLKGLSEVPELKPVKVTLTIPDKVYKEKMYFMVVMNGKSAGGFRMVSPDAEINDGMLDIMLFRDMKIFEMPHMFFQLIQGKHGSNKNVLQLQVSSLKVESEVDLPTDIDGEHGEKLPLEFSVLNKRLKINTREEL